MIDHIGFSVSDYARAKAFYEKALAPLGYVLVKEVKQDEARSSPAAGFGTGGKPDFWIGGEGALNKPVHVAIAAKDRRRSMRSTRRRSPRAARTTARRASARTIIRTTTAPSSSIPMGTTSKRSATRRRERDRGAPQITLSSR